MNTNRTERTIAVLQPGYLPWLGFFDQMRRSDVFVVYDDVQFDKHGWRNRNRIKTPQGAQWITVPVRHHGTDKPSNRDIEIDNSKPWQRKHLGTLKQHYCHAVYFSHYWPTLQDILAANWDKLCDLNMALIHQIMRWLEIQCEVILASTLGCSGYAAARLLLLCERLQATRYLTGDAAQAYLDEGAFQQRNIAVEWQHYVHPVYPQLHGAFISHLSVLDLLFNCGPSSAQFFPKRGGLA